MTDSFPYLPGTYPVRQFEGYNPHQEALWQAFEDTYWAWTGGYGACRQATPGKRLDMGRFEAWRAKAVSAWANESQRDSRTGAPGASDLPEELWLYLYERMLAAPGLATITTDTE